MPKRTLKVLKMIVASNSDQSERRRINSCLVIILVACALLMLVTGCTVDNPETASFTVTLEAEPDNTSAYLNRCATYLENESYAEAVADCSKALQLQPGNITALRNRAATYSKQNNMELALADWKAALNEIERSAATLSFWEEHRPEQLNEIRQNIQNAEARLSLE
jgi:tetratricopeptide (TPR) repeat protein